MRWTEHRFIGFDETPLFYRRLRVESRPKAVLLMVHGMGEHGGRYKDFAGTLGAEGIESVMPDLRGFGKSGGKRGCIRQFSDYHKDLEALHGYLVRENKPYPIFILGHSFGGLIVSSYLAQSDCLKPQGFILSSPAFGIAVPIPAWRNAIGMCFSALSPDLTQDNQVNPVFLTHDSIEVEKYKTDGLVHHKISARLYSQTKKLLGRHLEIAKKIVAPALVLQAGDDRVVLKDETIRFFEALGGADKEIEIYAGFYHEILKEKEKRRVYIRIVEWIFKHI